MRVGRFAVRWSTMLAALVSVVAAVAVGSASLPFEGDLSDTPYGSLSDGVYSMQFAIYDAIEGGIKMWPAESWVETHPFVAVSEGRFSVTLGDHGHPIHSDVLIGRQAYVQIAVCSPAGYECVEHEPLPLRLPLETSTTGASAYDSTPSIITTPPLSTALPGEADAESSSRAAVAGAHVHWGETWMGLGIGLALINEAPTSGAAAVGLRGASTFSGLSIGVLGEVTSSNPLSVGLKGTATRGIGVLGVADPAYDTSVGGFFSGWTGVHGEAFGANAPGVMGISRVNTGIGLWGESEGRLGYAGYFAAPRGTGLYVGHAGLDGIYVLQAGDEGLEIHDAGFAASHLYPLDLELGETSNGVTVGGARDYGVWVGFSGRAGVAVGRSGEYGFWVGEAAADGVRIEGARQSGLSIGRAELAGIEIAHAGTTGLLIENANLFGVHVSSQATAVHAQSVHGPGGEFLSEENHALVVDGTALIGGRTPEQIGMLKWYEARGIPGAVKTEPGPSGLAFDGEHIWVTHDGPIDMFSPPKILQLRASDGFKESERTVLRGSSVGPLHDGLRIWYVFGGGSGGGFSLRGEPAGWASTSLETKAYASVYDTDAPTCIAFDGRHIWVGAHDGVYRLTPTDASYEHLPRWDLALIGDPRLTSWGMIEGSMFELNTYRVTCSALAFDGTSMWVANIATDKVIRLHAENMQNTGVYDVGDAPTALAFDGANVWVANSGDATVTKLRASDGHTLGTYRVGTNPRALVFDGFHIWVANERDDTLTKLRAVDGLVVGMYKTGRSPRALVFDGTHVWVANHDDDSLMKF